MTQGPIDAWLVPLTGDQFDLEDLPIWLSGGRVRVVIHESVHHLLVPATAVGTTYEPVRAFAEEKIHLINGAARLLSPGYRPVALSDRIFGIDASGRVVHTVLAVEPAEIRMRGGVAFFSINDQPPEDPRIGAAMPLLAVAERSAVVRDVLTLLARRTPTWSELYIAFELVQADVGSSMHDRGWVSESQAELFARTANSYTALGLAGRHGKDRGDPPSKPMSHPDATALVLDLVRSWLLHLAGENPSAQAG